MTYLNVHYAVKIIQSEKLCEYINIYMCEQKEMIASMEPRTW